MYDQATDAMQAKAAQASNHKTAMMSGYQNMVQSLPPDRTLSAGLHRLSNLLDFARDLAARTQDTADNLAGPVPSAASTGQQSAQGTGSVGALYGLADQFEATLVRLQDELGRIRAAHG